MNKYLSSFQAANDLRQQTDDFSSFKMLMYHYNWQHRVNGVGFYSLFSPCKYFSVTHKQTS